MIENISFLGTESASYLTTEWEDSQLRGFAVPLILGGVNNKKFSQRNPFPHLKANEDDVWNYNLAEYAKRYRLKSVKLKLVIYYVLIDGEVEKKKNVRTFSWCAE